LGCNFNSIIISFALILHIFLQTFQVFGDVGSFNIQYVVEVFGAGANLVVVVEVVFLDIVEEVESARV
jgi:hypothetical protein